MVTVYCIHAYGQDMLGSPRFMMFFPINPNPIPPFSMVMKKPKRGKRSRTRTRTRIESRKIVK
jgi:hypothetical protein